MNCAFANPAAILSDRTSGRWTRLLVGFLTVALATMWAALHLDHGWFPHDEGQLGQAAERILNGQLPHRDFDDMYTGGLSFLNALSFWLWGVSSLSMRTMLLIAFIPFVMSVYWLVTEFVRPWAGGLVALLAAAWSIPIYPAAMPSWYNLFLATWALCAVHLYIKSGHRRWLLLAGLAIGLSITSKVSGLFAMGAVLLLLLYRNQLQFAPSTQNDNNKQPARSDWLSRFIMIGLAMISLLGLVFLNRHDWPMQTIHLVIPFAALVGFVVWHERLNAERIGRSSHSSFQRCQTFFLDVAPLLAGLTVPIVILIGWYARHDALDDLVNGALLMPGRRLEFAWGKFPDLGAMIFSLPLIVLFLPALFGWRITAKRDKVLSAVLLMLACVLLSIQFTPAGFAIGFDSVRNLTPGWVLAVLAFLCLKKQSLSDVRRQQIFAATAFAFFTSLIQYPYPAPMYFFYSAPLLVVSVLIVVGSQPRILARTLAATVLLLILVAAWRYHGSLPGDGLERSYRPVHLARLDSERCPLRIRANEARVYNRLHELIAQHTEPGETIFATPDSPQICFMTGRRAINGVMYEFFRDGLYDDPATVLRELTQANVNVVIINECPPFSPTISEELRTEILKDFRELEVIYNRPGDSTSDKLFTVYLRKN